MDEIYPNPIYHNLPPNKLTKGPLSFQKKMQESKNQALVDQNQNISDDFCNRNSNIKESVQSSISSSSSGDLIDIQFEEYQKQLRNPNKAIRDRFTVTKKLKKKSSNILNANIIPQNNIETTKPKSIIQKPRPLKSSIVSQRSISSHSMQSNQYCTNIRIPNGHISSLTPNIPLNLINTFQTFGNSSFNSISNFNSKSKHDPFDNEYIYNLDLNQKTDLTDPKLNITGKSVVGASITYLRPQKMTTFEEKTNISPSARLNWIKFRANPVKKPKPYSPPISKEDQFLNNLLTPEGLKKARERNEALILSRKQQAENQKILDYGNNSLCASMEKATSNQKVKVISKTMAINDF